MLNILCVCGNGMGTSTILKINIQNICNQSNIEANVESCAFGEAMAYMHSTDLVITSPEWADMLPPSNAVVAVTTNLVDAEGVKKTMIEAIEANFPQYLKK